MSSPRFYAHANGQCGLSNLPIRGENMERQGDEVFYLVAVCGENGIPSPTQQLETLRTTDWSGNECVVREVVGTGWTKRGGQWALRTVVARREYSFLKSDSTEVKNKKKADAVWFKPGGQKADIWCRLVLSDEAGKRGFKLPKSHIGSDRRPGNRGVGYEDKVSAAPVINSTPVTEVEVKPSNSLGPNMADVL